jgi:hypothetical protein
MQEAMLDERFAPGTHNCHYVVLLPSRATNDLSTVYGSTWTAHHQIRPGFRLPSAMSILQKGIVVIRKLLTYAILLSVWILGEIYGLYRKTQYGYARQQNHMARR